MIKLLLSKKLSLGIGLLSAAAGFAQWNSNTAINTPVCIAGGLQVDLRMCDDGQKGAFIVWKDYRMGGAADIYAQHLDSLGNPKWTANGVPVCTQTADQSTPAIISDMNGGVIISWSDWRTGIERDLYAQRLDANGNPLWMLNGVIVSNKNEREHNQRMVSDGAGGAIIIFENQSQTTWSWEVWGQRINSSGNIMWTPGGVKLSNLNVEFLNPRIQSDGKGGVFVTWQDFRNGIDYDVYVQRVGPTGILKWGNTAKLACTTSGTQTNPKIDPDSASGGCIVAWTDKRNGLDYDIYAQRMDSLGNLLWGNSAAAVCTAAGNQSAVDIFSNPKTGGVIFTWKDLRNGATYDIYAQKLNTSGVGQWVTNGIAVCNAANDQLNPNITGDANGGAVIVWQDIRTGPNYDVYAQRITKNGAIVWTANGVPVGTAANSQTSPKNVSDDAGGTIVAFEDTRAGAADIYAHKIFYDGYNVGLEEETNLAYLKCYPNPFTETINVSYILMSNDRISVKLYNLLGEEVADIGSGLQEKAAGMHSVSINANDIDLQSGIYFVKVAGEKFSVTRKVIKD
jgi:hypothetical protein